MGYYRDKKQFFYDIKQKIIRKLPEGIKKIDLIIWSLEVYGFGENMLQQNLDILQSKGLIEFVNDEIVWKG